MARDPRILRLCRRSAWLGPASALALALGLAGSGVGRVAAQGPTLPGDPTPSPGSVRSTLGPIPGAGANPFGMSPGTDAQFLGGRAGTSTPRVPTSVST